MLILFLPTVTVAWSDLGLTTRPTFTSSKRIQERSAQTLYWSQDDDLITSCLQPVVTQHQQQHRPCWRGRGGSAEDGQIPRFPSRGAGWRDEPEHKSDFAGRKGEGRGTSDKSAEVALFYPCSFLTVTQACELWIPPRWGYYTHKAEPGLIFSLFCSVTIQSSTYSGPDSDKCGSREPELCNGPNAKLLYMRSFHQFAYYDTLTFLCYKHPRATSKYFPLPSASYSLTGRWF